MRTGHHRLLSAEEQRNREGQGCPGICVLKDNDNNQNYIYGAFKMPKRVNA
jgi:hypothetical protein